MKPEISLVLLAISRQTADAFEVPVQGVAVTAHAGAHTNLVGFHKRLSETTSFHSVRAPLYQSLVAVSNLSAVSLETASMPSLGGT